MIWLLLTVIYTIYNYATPDGSIDKAPSFEILHLTASLKPFTQLYMYCMYEGVGVFRLLTGTVCAWMFQIDGLHTDNKKNVLSL